MLSKKGFVWIISIVFLVIISILSFFLIYLPYQIFDHKPMAFPEKKFDIKTINSLSAKIQKIMPQIVNSKPEDVLTLDLTTDEINTVILFAENGQSYQDVLAGNLDIETKTNKPYVIFFQDGIFHILISKKVELFKVFDEYINMSVTLKPYIKDGKSLIKVKTAMAGDLKVPRRFLQNYLDDEMQKVNNTEEYKMLAPILKEVIVTDKNELHISFKPFRLKQIMMQFLLK